MAIVHNSDIAEMFNRTADLLEIKGENPFRVRAYRDAARTIEGLSENVRDLIESEKKLHELPGIGKDLAGKIAAIVKNGKFSLLENLKKEVPLELAGLMNLSGLGPKKVRKLYRELDIKSVKDLQKAAREGQIVEIEGFGEKTRQQILEEVKRAKSRGGERMKLIKAEEMVAPLIEYLKSSDVKDLEIAGSFRRRRETVGDIDILATCKKGSDVMDRFTGYDDVRKIVSRGKTRSTVLLRSGLQVDLRVVPEVSFGAALVYFTGSKAHNIAIRKIAVSKKYKINEYGVYKGKDRIAGRTEEDVYKKIKLKWIEPELRENRGEIEAAKKNKLPELIRLEDIRGDLHVHSNHTDGRYSIEEMARAAKERGYDYIALTDHSKSVTVAGGLDEKALRKELKEIDSVRKKIKGFTLLKGIEVDILEDGSLDLADEILQELDVRVCSVHSKFKLSRKKQTERIIRAMDNPYFNILGHPTGRLIGERDPYDVDMDKILHTAKERNIILELNAHPDRLDLNDIHLKNAKDMGLKIVISTDAHRKSNYDYMKYGVYQARRGWLEADDVINTQGIRTLKKLLKR